MHFHTMTPAEPGIDRCTSCPHTEANRYTAPVHNAGECRCGRGFADFKDVDGTWHCAACFNDRVEARRKAA